ncbi:hypothetical protein D9615_008412 [Tricholomella constricta]|uniref:Small ribosomal subunit protein uS5m n=1 Tax=Tricholomella constricta TaxID=117010 RepID=A0A8H5M5A1_9AGAR|nr:hypothetical protein D9615_008412 [Tricholomella constricta]
MHRLSRQVLCPRNVSRLVRVQRTPGATSSLPVVLGRHYASSERPTSPPDRFDKLLASLPKVKDDELATTIAALISSEMTDDKRDKLQRALPRFMGRGPKKHLLIKKVNKLLGNPPAGNFDAFVARLPTKESSKITKESVASEISSSVPSEKPSLFEANGNPTSDWHRTESVLHNETEPDIEKLFAQMREQNEFEEDDEDGFELPDEFKFEEERKITAALEAAEETDVVIEPPERPPPNPFPNLMASDPLLDSRDVLELPPDKNTPFHNRVIIRNHSSIFNEALAEDGFDFGADDYVPTKTDETEESASSMENLPFSPSELSNFYRFPLIHKRITQQTGKGKIHRQFVLMVVGNGDGMVGLGQGKDDDASRAEAKAYAQAVRNMDWVERFEKRTIWTDMEAKLGATQLILRPRPVGFGLRCNPNLHQVLKAAGIKDISAKVWGSRNPINVIKAAFRMLQAGHAPLAMGDGIGGPGRKLNKGSGLRSKSDMERERGRQLISLRK